MPDWSIEAARGGLVAGVDEVGRGPLAGPVVAGAVILFPLALPRSLIRRIDDSKALDAEEREKIALLLWKYCGRGVLAAVAAASAQEIERINILQASLLAMRRAVARLPVKPGLVLVDGNVCPKGLPCAAEPVVDGDAKSLSIAAASIIAKVVRDRLMARLARRYPAYGWERNAGYGTPEHRRALASAGPTRHHRRSFAPLLLLMQQPMAPPVQPDLAVEG